ncbi:ATP-dependent helicase [Actinomadura sp. B10D3]|uniref:ATP-dependent helicase n=1 Tax=Actinomadura sp. B10D3 TaxID=3153557 RepID=UPI00325E2E98
MTTDQELAAAQQEKAITALAPLYVQACPGAGKTHVIVSRHLAQPASLLRHGRALISFTRTARDQMAERCRAEGRADLAGFPHFIGTMDSFIWDFLVFPHLPTDRPWQLFDSWSAVRATVQLDRTVPLDAFTFTFDPCSGVESVPVEALDRSARQAFHGTRRPWRHWEEEAKRVRNQLMKQGYLTCHESRILAWQHLRQRPDEVLVPLRSRFSEIMIDEAQDCSTTEIAILDTFHAAGLKLTVVGDPDQMIYGWREADRKALTDFTAKLDSTVELTGNRRSTPTICALAATLRTGARSPDLSIAGHHDDPPVLILPTTFGRSAKAVHSSGIDTARVFCQHAERFSIPATSCLVTARRRATLPIPSSERGGNPITRLARAYQVIASGIADADKIEQACRVAASVLLGYWFPGSSGSPASICKAHDLQVGDLLRRGYAFLAELPQPHPAWSTDVNTTMKNVRSPSSAAPKGTAGHLRGRPVITAKDPAQMAGPRMDNVHQVKGDQADAVLVMLPETGTAAAWREEDPAENEELRIMYVAVTRARRLLGMAVRDEELGEITALLTQFSVDHQVIS